MTQDDIFNSGEGDNWFKRNKEQILTESRIENDPVLKLLQLMKLVPGCVLEVGASNGYRLQEMQKRYQCACYASDCSQEAVKDGAARYPDTKFTCCTASQMPYQDGQFDLVIINFVFTWIDRALLLRSVAELDRVLRDGGYLIIGDFHPSQPEKVKYHHLPSEDVWTYKQEYIDMFLSSNIYDLLAFITGDCKDRNFSSSADPTRRTQVALLQKNLHGRYKLTENV